MNDFLANLGVPITIAGDISLFGILLLGSLLLGFVVGRFRLVHFVLHLYIAYGFALILPQSILSSSPYVQIIVFIGFLIFLSLLGERLFDIHARPSVYGWISVLFLGFFTSGFLLGITFQFLPVTAFVWEIFSQKSVSYFTGVWIFVFWFIAPLLALLFINSKR
jgi:hypothetical protein